MKPNWTRDVATLTAEPAKVRFLNEEKVSRVVVSNKPNVDPLPFGDIPDPLDTTETDIVRRREPSLSIAPGRGAVRLQRWTGLALSLAWLGTHLAVYGVRPDLAQLSTLYVAAQVAVPFGFAVGALFVALNPGRNGLGVRIAVVFLLAILGPASFVLIGLGAPAPRVLPSDPNFWLNAVLCLDVTLAWTSVPLLCAAAVLRHSFASAAQWKSALVGGGCGLFAGATMNLHCANADGVHMALGHGIPVVIAAAVGAFVMSRWARA